MELSRHSFLRGGWRSVSKGSIVLSYKGDALKHGVMDVNDLAPALLAMGDLLQRANRLLNGDATKVKVNVRAGFQIGSFEVVFDILQSLADQLRMLVGNGDRPYTAQEILQFLGFASSISGLTGLNLIETVRLIRGRRISNAVALPSDQVEISIEGDNNTTIIHKHVYNFICDEETMKRMGGVLDPLKNQGIDALEVKEVGREEPVSRVDKEEVVYFRPTKELDSEIEYVAKTLLKVVGLFFEGKSMWRFSDGDQTFAATITDQSFLKKLDNRLIAFAKGDTLLVEMKVKQRRVNGEIKVEREIFNVIEHNTWDQPPLLP